MACYLCEDATTNEELTEENDLAYFIIGRAIGQYRISYRVSSKSGHFIQFEKISHIPGIWETKAYYEPNFCPNCGRKLK